MNTFAVINKGNRLFINFSFFYDHCTTADTNAQALESAELGMQDKFGYKDFIQPG